MWPPPSTVFRSEELSSAHRRSLGCSGPTNPNISAWHLFLDDSDTWRHEETAEAPSLGSVTFRYWLTGLPRHLALRFGLQGIMLLHGVAPGPRSIHVASSCKYQTLV